MRLRRPTLRVSRSLCAPRISLHARHSDRARNRISGSDLPPISQHDVLYASTRPAVLVGMTDDRDLVACLDRIFGPAHPFQDGDRRTLESVCHGTACLDYREIYPDVRVRPLDVLHRTLVADHLG